MDINGGAEVTLRLPDAIELFSDLEEMAEEGYVYPAIGDRSDPGPGSGARIQGRRDAAMSFVGGGGQYGGDEDC
ncbi:MULTISPECIES: hypothetical protein [unclassified Nonomuraea]|uniref:hypothetical protein n=1 Tax=unclassified Nonomuraea TaxID=2593643 RepID=UPI0033E0EF78